MKHLRKLQLIEKFPRHVTNYQVSAIYNILHILTDRPFTKDDLDLIYESYVMAKLQNNSKTDDDDVNSHQIKNMFANNRAGELKGEERQILSLIPDAASLYDMARTLGTSVAGIMAFLSANSDVLTALGIVSQLEAKTQYDPRFRNSIPKVIRDNAPDWIL